MVVVRRAVRMVTEGRVTASDGADIALHVDPLCTQGDTPGAAELTRHLRQGVEQMAILSGGQGSAH